MHDRYIVNLEPTCFSPVNNGEKQYYVVIHPWSRLKWLGIAHNRACAIAPCDQTLCCCVLCKGLYSTPCRTRGASSVAQRHTLWQRDKVMLRLLELGGDIKPARCCLWVVGGQVPLPNRKLSKLTRFHKDSQNTISRKETRFYKPSQSTL